MSRRKDFPLDKSARAELASRVKTLRRNLGIKQDELAEYAQVSRQTLSDIENNRTVPQEASLIRILQVLGVDVEGPEFEEQTDLWLSVIGTLIEAIPEQGRGAAVDRVVRSLAEDIKSGTKPNVGASYEDEDFDVTPWEGAQSDLALAAKKGRKKINEDAPE